MQILITGGAGSLGKAFVRHLVKDHQLTIIDNNEWAVAELQKEFPQVKCLLKDFSEWRFDQEPCDLVIHTAAYKHVNLGEDNPDDFIDNNILKTRRLFAEAFKNNTDILFISTDKAVEPISLYGFTKAIGEKLAKHYNGAVVRLGNILQSSGSVIPVWEKCLKEGQTIPITSTKMVRYVIEEDEAVKAIIRGYDNGEKLIIPHCRKIKIMDLLKDVLRRHGYSNLKGYLPGVRVVGARAGEKLEEKMRWDDET